MHDKGTGRGAAHCHFYHSYAPDEHIIRVGVFVTSHAVNLLGWNGCPTGQAEHGLRGLQSNNHGFYMIALRGFTRVFHALTVTLSLNAIMWLLALLLPGQLNH